MPRSLFTAGDTVWGQGRRWTGWGGDHLIPCTTRPLESLGRTVESMEYNWKSLQDQKDSDESGVEC